MSKEIQDKLIPSAVEATEAVTRTGTINEQKEIIENEIQKSGNEIQANEHNQEENERN